jgi:uncharacterized protein involved in exopolysaccharide biosynthesis
MFMGENLRQRQDTAQGTTDFLGKTLEDAKQKLDAQDARLADFKRRYIGQLPGEEQAMLTILTGLNTQLETVNQAISSAQQDKTFLNAQLTQQLSVWQASKAQGNPDTLQQQLTAMQAELARLRARYTDEHHDVIAQKRLIADLQRKIDEAAAAPDNDKPGEKTGDNGKPDEKAAATKAKTLEPPAIQQLRTSVFVVDQRISENTHEQERLQQQIRKLQGQLQLSPMVEQQYKELTRDYQTALGFYNEILSKKNESEMARDLEKRQQGEQFQVMDPANLPEKPNFPNRQYFAGGGLGGGLALGLAIALLLEFRDKAMRTERDVEAFLGVPTLALVPILVQMNGKKVSFWKRQAKPKLEQQEQRAGS